MNITVIVIGAVMLLGSFATISSRSSSQFDHDFGLLLLVAGIICIIIGADIVDVQELIDMGKPKE